jgi:very-short-patch-repair endonuclease
VRAGGGADRLTLARPRSGIEQVQRRTDDRLGVQAVVAVDRQVVRRRPSGREYLDCRFDAFRLTVEVDGMQHEEPERQLSDVVRDLTLVADGDDGVRIPRTAMALDQRKVCGR